MAWSKPNNDAHLPTSKFNFTILTLNDNIKDVCRIILLLLHIFNDKILKKSFYLKAEKVPNTPAELIPTAKPTIKPILTRSKQEGPATGGG